MCTKFDMSPNRSMEQKLSDENYFISMNPPMFPFEIIFLYILNHERSTSSESGKYWY